MEALGLATGTGNPEGQMRAYGAVGTLFSIVNRLYTATAAPEWHLHRKMAGTDAYCEECDEQGVEMVPEHAALDVLNRPNSFYTRQSLMEAGQQHQDLTGENWLVLRRLGATASGPPFEMWPVRPDRMYPVPDTQRYLAGYIYRSPDGEEVPLRVGEVIQLKLPNPLDPYRGMGPVQAALLDLESAQAAAQWNANFFRNSAEPGGIIKFDRNLSDPEFDQFTARWREQHRGVSNAHRVAILEEGAEWVDRSYTNRDIQFAELSQLSDQKIRGAFGIPKFAVGDVDDVNRATAEAAKAWFGEQLTVPRLERWRQALNVTYLPMFAGGDTLEFAYCSPVPADREADNAERESKANTYKTLIDAGVDPEDAAMVAGLPPMRAKAVVTPPPAPPAPPEPPEPGAPPEPESPENLARLHAGVEYHAWHEQAQEPDDCGACLTEARVYNVKRWVAVEHLDDNTCQPCKDNDGHLYTTRGEAYADYPGGSDYVKCLGHKGGNKCRGRVVKRGKKGGK